MIDPPCQVCSGPVAVVLKRAWCLKPYAEGGCGSFWSNWPRGRQRDRWGSL